MKVYFYNGRKQRLVGILQKQGKKGVILSHGFNGNKESQFTFSKFLLDSGYSTLGFDYSGHGESEGNLADTTLTRWVDDLNAAIDFMQKHCNDIALLGFSFGGMSSLVCSKRSRATIAIAPPSNFRKLAVHFIKTGLVKRFEKFIDFEGLNIKHTFIADSARLDIKKIMKKISCPILIIHGNEDDIVPLSQSEEIIEHINEPKRLVVMNGFGHGSANEAQMGIIRKEIIAWFEKYL